MSLSAAFYCGGAHFSPVTGPAISGDRWHLIIVGGGGDPVTDAFVDAIAETKPPSRQWPWLFKDLRAHEAWTNAQARFTTHVLEQQRWPQRPA